MAKALDAPPPDFRLLVHATEGLPAAVRFDSWRDIVSRKLLRMNVDLLCDAPFKATAMLRSQHGVTIGVGEIGATINRRTGEIVSADNDDVVLLANLSGDLIADGAGGELTLNPGEATLVSCALPGAYARPSGGRLLCARVPRPALALLAPDPERRVGRVIPRDTSALRMLIAYASPLWDEGFTAAEPDVSRYIVNHICDLVALCAGASGDAAAFAAERGGRAARLQAVKAAIETRVGGPAEFSVEDIAADVGVSARYVRKLLEAEGASFSRFVAERRLVRAYALLTDPKHARMSVSAIAYEVGFGDLSYFNRSFRRAYDCTPSDLRSERRQRSVFPL